ncbi:T9SS type A sorting domain-containing protein [uncultured Algibacter sp.]|uniref:T9SS type A sorting domain-containing protein n=1 Tax=uncultured Algibacter sp. TaxID=298659 RepID=UPI0032173D39
MRKNYILFFALLMSITIKAQQDITLLRDINPSGNSDISLASEKSMIEFNGKLYFTANNGTNGSELWVYDGTTTELFFDINPGASGSDCDNFFVINNKLIFTADDGAHGTEWWVTDGTVGNTELLKDIFSGTDDGLFFSSFSSLTSFAVFNDKVYFAGIDRRSDFELWSTDGTAEGTKIVKNIVDDSFFVRGSFPEDYAILNDELLFSCRDGLWKTDGTEAGTVEVDSSLDPSDLVTLGNKVIFWNNSSIWTTDGTSAGTTQIKVLNRPTTNNSNELAFTILGDKALFAGSDTTNGPELWISDGTEAGTQLVLDADPGTDGYAPQNKAVFKDKLYYKGNNGQDGIELWTSDGTPSGTFMLKDIAVGNSSGFTLPSEIYATDKYIYMSAGGGFNTNLWVSDGTEEDTKEIIITNDDENKPKHFFSYNGGVVFFALNSNARGREPHFISEGTLSVGRLDSQLLIDIYPNPTSDFISINDKNKSIKSISITDITGKVIESFTNIEDSKMKISFADKAQGIYFVKLNSGFSSITKKIIKR